MSNKYFGGVVADKGATEAVDEDLKQTAVSTYGKVEAKMQELRVADALTEILVYLSAAINILMKQNPGCLQSRRKRRTDCQQYSTIWLRGS